MEARDPQSRELPGLIDVAAAPADPVRAGLFEASDRGRESSRKVVVVAVDIRNELSAGAGKTLIQSMGLSAVRFRHPPGEPVCVALDDLNGSVGRASVDDDVLEVG